MVFLDVLPWGRGIHTGSDRSSSELHPRPSCVCVLTLPLAWQTVGADGAAAETWTQRSRR